MTTPNSTPAVQVTEADRKVADVICDYVFLTRPWTRDQVVSIIAQYRAEGSAAQWQAGYTAGWCKKCEAKAEIADLQRQLTSAREEARRLREAATPVPMILESYRTMLEGMKEKVVAEIGGFEWAVCHGAATKSAKELFTALTALSSAPVTNPDKAIADHCRAFIAKQTITCAESVHQSDRVIENAYEFIEGVCKLAGYHKPTDGE